MGNTRFVRVERACTSLQWKVKWFPQRWWASVVRPSGGRDSSRNSRRKDSLLLLLLLLQCARAQGGKNGPRLNDDIGSGRGQDRRVRRANCNGDAQFAAGLAFMNAAGRRNIRIIAPDGDPEVAIATNQIVGRIEGGPPQIRHERFN